MKLLPSLLLLCFALHLNAQGIHFSDNREVPLQLNPAFAGAIHNKYVHRLVLAHRRQGNAVLGRDEFETTYLSYDLKLGLCDRVEGMYIGLGLELLHDQVGRTLGEEAQFFHRQEANANAALGISLGKGSYLMAGVRGGLLSHGLREDRLTFDNQFDGRDFDASRSSLENFATERIMHFDLGAGVILRGTIPSRGVDRFVRVETYELGLSLMHLNNKRDRFLANSVVGDLVREYRVHAKFDLLFEDRFRMRPALLFYKFGGFFNNGKQWQLRPLLEFPALNRLMFAGGTRISNFAERGSHLDALVFTLKWKPYRAIGGGRTEKDHLIVGVSVDVNISPQLVPATGGFGAFELFVTKYFNGDRTKPVCCPSSNTENQVFY
ncbi:MAG: PorP/SprF family type IX secretion system membrane protein [Bacteroidota bacterium]